MDLQELVAKSHTTAVEKGWWEGAETPDSVPAKIALMHSELSEALEEYRAGRPLAEIYYRASDGKPEGFLVELADVVVRIGDLCGRHGLNLEEAVKIKMAFNETRSHRHGGKVV